MVFGGCRANLRRLGRQLVVVLTIAGIVAPCLLAPAASPRVLKSRGMALRAAAALASPSPLPVEPMALLAGGLEAPAPAMPTQGADASTPARDEETAPDE